MTKYPMPPMFDGAKFRERYGLNEFDFWDDGEGSLCIADGITLPDIPIFEAPENPLVLLRKLAASLVDESIAESAMLRATLAVILDELNNHADKINAILDAVDAATSLADLKTRVAAITNYPQRTLAQAKTSIQNKIDSGDAD